MKQKLILQMVLKKRLNGTKMNFSKKQRETNLSSDSSSTPGSSVKKNLVKMSFIVISHVAFTGHAQELKDFLKRNSETLIFIGHPFSYAIQNESIAELYKKNELISELKATKIVKSEFFLYLKDFFTSFYFIFRLRMKFNVCIGVDPLNTLVGLVLKRLGLTQIVVFYVIDYVPCRFNNVILNSVYRSLDRLCVLNADYTWNLTSAMADAREKIGIRKNETNQITVPTGTHFEKLKKMHLTQPEQNTVVFVSHLRKGQGIELVLEALPKVVKQIPSVKIIIIGTGPLEKYFKEEAKKRNLTDNIVFLGYIEDPDEIDKIVAKCRVGIAPYVPDPDSFTWYADPGKPKVYLGCGIPVIITKVPEVACEISKRGAGIAINYNSHELSEAIVKILCDDKLNQTYRANAIKFASELDWASVFTEAFSRILESNNNGQ
jgi:glycosyltransferase involved in cell wall biosynthesis